MTTIRGRAIKLGGVATQPTGFAGRAQDQVTRPAFVIQAGIRKPTGGPPAYQVGQGTLWDPSTPGFWRIVLVAGAFLYVVGFHVSLHGIRMGIGPGK